MFDSFLFKAESSTLGGLYNNARALTRDELEQRDIALSYSMRQAQWPLSYYQGLAQYQPPDPRPLDERFADFKKRLAAAIAKHSRPAA